MSEKVAVYELRVHGTLMYIGVTKNPKHRLRVHRGRHSIVSHHIRLNVIQWFETRASALKEETKLIKLHSPPWNFVNSSVEKSKRYEAIKQGDIQAASAVIEEAKRRWAEHDKEIEKMLAEQSKR